jgi:transposase
MTQPTTYSWYPVGERLFVPYEANEGRRVNVIGGYFSHGPEAGRFEFEARVKLPQSKAKKRRKSLEERANVHGVRAEDVGVIDAERLLSFVWKLAGRPEGALPGWKRERPLVILLDNYSVHKSERVQAERTALEAADVHLFFLPSYSPELSKIEPVWQDVKYRELTTRSFDQLGDLLQAVKDALKRKADKLQAACHTDHFLPLTA